MQCTIHVSLTVVLTTMFISLHILHMLICCFNHYYSAGVGRTGTFICIDSVLEQIKKEKVIDIAGSITKMRHQRMKMVQTPVSSWVQSSLP